MTTPTITQYPDTLPAKGQANAAFDTNVDNFLTWQTATFGPELATLITWTVGVRDSVLAAALAGDLPPLTGEALKVPRANAAEDNVEFATVTQAAWDLLDDANAAAQRVTLGVAADSADTNLANDPDAALRRDIAFASFERTVGFVEVNTLVTFTATGAWAGDDTIPQLTEGTALGAFDLTVTKALGSSDTALEIDLFAPISGAGQLAYAAIFRDSEASAVAASGVSVAVAGALDNIIVRRKVTGLAAGSYTFTVRACTSAGTAALNGLSASGRGFGGASAAYFRVREVPA
jgi:hypothetical protein